MGTDLKNSEDIKNPLKLVLGISFIFTIFYVIKFTNLLFGKSSNEILGCTVALILSLSYVIAYYQRSMLAWWIALLFLPIVWTVTIVLYEPSIHWKEPVGIGIGWLVFIMPYLAQRYKPYKQYITGTSEKLISGKLVPDLKDTEDNKNPLNLALGVAILWAILDLINFSNFILDKSLTELGAEQHDRIIMFLLKIFFVVAYYLKSMLAWWIAILFIPIVWALELVFDKYSLGWKGPVITAVVWFVFMLPYFRRRYKPYKNFIAKQIGQDL